MSLADQKPFDDILSLIKAMPQAKMEVQQAFDRHNSQLAKPEGSLGELENLALWMSLWQQQVPPQMQRPVVAVFAANHSFAYADPSGSSLQETQNRVDALAAGGAAVNQLCLSYNLSLKVFDLALDVPLPDITNEAAFTEKECAATIAWGMEAIAGGTDLLCIGHCGAGGLAGAAAILAALYGGQGKDWLGQEGLQEKEAYTQQCQLIDDALKAHKDELTDPLSILRCLGGREIAAIMGAIVAARYEKIPVLLDGMVATAAAALLKGLNDKALDHCRIALCAHEKHKTLVKRLGLKPLSGLSDLWLDSGTGAALAAGLMRGNVAVYQNMVTKEQLAKQV
jgi:nicotinate-nucleotide--dimethylbenzimidazole phosphoribosyltransferase